MKQSSSEIAVKSRGSKIDLSLGLIIPVSLRLLAARLDR